MPYELDVAGGESAGKRMGERKKERARGRGRDRQWTLGPPVGHRESTVLSGTTNVSFQ